MKDKLTATGILFGEAAFVEHANIAIFAYSDDSLAPTFLLQGYNGNFRGRMKADEMRNLRDALDKAISWMEEKTCIEREKPKQGAAETQQGKPVAVFVRDNES